VGQPDCDVGTVSGAELAASLEERLRLAEDRAAILGAAYRFNVLVNYGGTVEDWRGVLTDDAHVTVSAPDGTLLAEDRGVESIRSARPPKEGRRDANLLAGPILTIEGDEATLESYWSVMSDSDSGPRVTMYGRATNTFVRAENGWLISSRHAEVEAPELRKGG
jgi:hypothetical protein